jgi:hypothetical protein
VKDQLLTARELIARNPELTYRRLWLALAKGLITPLGVEGDHGEAIDIELGPDGKLPPSVHVRHVRDVSFREFMAREGFDHLDTAWSTEDVAAWVLDERA